MNTQVEAGTDQNPMKNLFKDENQDIESGKIGTQATKVADTVTETVLQERERKTNKDLVLEIVQGEIIIPDFNTGTDLIKENPDLIDIEEIRQLFKNYDGSIKSIENIFDVLKKEALERLKKFDGNVEELFGTEFTELVEKLKEKLNGVSKHKKNLIEEYTGNRIKKLIRKIKKKVGTDIITEVLANISGTTSFVVDTDSKINKKINEAIKINEESKEEFKRLLTQYAIQKILEYIVEQKINNYDNKSSDGETKNKIKKNFQKQLFEARLRGIKTNLVNLALTLKITDGVTNEVDNTVTEIKTSQENLITVLSTLITNVRNIQTLNEANEISNLLNGLKEISINETGKSYIQLIEEKKTQIEGKIKYHKTIQETYEQILNEEKRIKNEIKKLTKELETTESKTSEVESKIMSGLNKDQKQIKE